MNIKFKIFENLLSDFPDLRQYYTYDCGVVALQSVLVYYGIEERGEEIQKLLDTNEEHGTSPESMIEVAQSFGLQAKLEKLTLQKLKDYIQAEIPVILMIQAWPENDHKGWEREYNNGHYCTAIGDTDEIIIFEDPSTFNRMYLTYSELEERWHDTQNGLIYHHFGIVVPGEKKYQRHQIYPLK